MAEISTYTNFEKLVSEQLAKAMDFGSKVEQLKVAAAARGVTITINYPSHEERRGERSERMVAADLDLHSDDARALQEAVLDREVVDPDSNAVVTVNLSTGTSAEEDGSAMTEFFSQVADLILQSNAVVESQQPKKFERKLSFLKLSSYYVASFTVTFR